MKYIAKGMEVSLPLTVESIENLLSSIHSKEAASLILIDLYRDVMLCVASGAGHAKDLAIAALKIEDLLK
jgi:hypothetical protein